MVTYAILGLAAGNKVPKLPVGTELVHPLSKDCFFYIIFLWLNNSSVNVKCPNEHKQDSLCKLDWTESYWKPFITNKQYFCRDPQLQIITDTQPSTETLCHNLAVNNLPNNVQDPFSSY